MPDLIHDHPIAQKLDQYTFDELNEHLATNFEHLDPEKLARTSPYEVGLFLERLTIDQRRTVLRKLSEEKASHILAEMNAEDSAEVVSAMREFRATKILELLEPDDAADLISKLEEKDQKRLLSRIQPEVAFTIRKLLRYDPNTAGGVMNPEVATLKQNWTVAKALENLRNYHKKIENLLDLYVLNEKNKLVGIATIQDLVFSSPEKSVVEVMDSNIKGICHPQTDKETVANIMAEYNLYAVPVVDDHDRLLGIVTHDDVLDIVQEAATADIQQLHGAGADESVHDPVLYSLKKRNPWLLINLCTAFLAATVISRFSYAIEKLSILAAFMTIIASLGGSTGAQTLAVAIRGLALGELQRGDALKLCLKEALKGLFNGTVIGLVGGIIATFISHNWLMGLTVFLAISLNMFLSGFVAALIPLLLKKLHFDPAQSAYIFLTAITDMTGLFIFLTLGSKLLLK